jgi:predicted AAA+ superfamily ATPase
MGLSAAEAGAVPQAELPFRPDRVEFSGMSQSRSDLIAVFSRIIKGNFPRMVQPNAPLLETFYDSYLQTYIERDVRALLDISNLAAFQRFLRILAARTGQLLNHTDAARDVGVAPSTARDWLHLLEATHQIYLLRPYFENIGKRQTKTPKLYFVDTGMACHLTGWRTPEAASSGAMAGPLLETFVVAEILRSYRHRGREAPIWFFRDKEKREVDVIIAEDGLLYPIEIKLAAAPDKASIRGIAALARQKAPLDRGAVLCLTERPYPLTPEVDALPLGCVQ